MPQELKTMTIAEALFLMDTNEEKARRRDRYARRNKSARRSSKWED